ncbi:acyl-CoA dehydrogenase family protein [Silvibacterium dinghuense]|uniref:Acyl-CoA dehydrogenase n=1 Tax=Silvibacterium dinghuense TaxID=1560006 RepID=A0A4Q1SGH4_9BACT|nr:acyl-CoA dehydrogenase family protein [Silvibacterium dinghuense]RXS96641.1 acyl-CoA dehydrogenase [Silvibacterium dinghuense]GGG92469.1 acyl-CoA dehydrogenase [Silvibacterium dinghuense]
MATLVSMTPVAGGSFLLHEAEPGAVFTPEDFTDEQRQIGETAADFALHEVLPAAAEIEAKNFEVTLGLLRKAGELGLMGVDVPEAYGGLAMDKVTSAVIADRLSVLASFSVAFSAHVGIGTLPLVWYGTEAQKQKYLPKLATGEWMASYALSEATSGSDAMSIRARAVRDGDHYVLNGEKMWITNAGFSNLFTIFAKIVDEGGDASKAKMTAFLVERTAPGLSIGPEEHKLGIRGASTCPVILNDCRVPVENLLGEPGKGHHIAFNILNIGRFKLGAACVGGARHSLANAVSYAKERRAFGKAIAEFGLIQQKISDSAMRIYVAESMAYRTIGAIDAALDAIPEEQKEDAREIQKRIEEYAVECSILKVWGSEMLDTVVDHTLQIYAGYGYVEEFPAERAYRDSRINRIFEGTNEINRLIISGFLMKRAMTGQLPLLGAIKTLMEELMAPPAFGDSDNGSDSFTREAKLLSNAKKLALFSAGAASQRYMQALGEQQEVMGALADMIAEIYAFDSALARARKLAAAGNANAAIAREMTQLFSDVAFQGIEAAAREVIAAVSEGDMLRTQMAILRRLAKHEPADRVALSRSVAQAVIARGRYPLA